MTASATDAARPRLCVAMILRDEQDVLAETLASVRAVGDEVVVLDTGSTDNTPAVAEQWGASVARGSWQNDFSEARNRCLASVGGDWVLWLNAGERLDPQSAEELRTFVDRRADPAAAYLLRVVLAPLAAAASPEEICQLRLLPRSAPLRFEGRVRETVRPSVEAAGLRIELAPGRIECHVRAHDASRKARIAQRNLELVECEAEESEPSARLLLAAGEALGDLGEHRPAQEAFRRAIELAERGSTEMLEGYYGLLTAYDADPEKRDSQLDTCLEALEVFPLDGQLLMAAANYLREKDRVDLAVRALRTAIELGQVNLEAWHLAELPEVAASCLALVLQTRGEDDEAGRVLDDALARSPGSLRIRRQLVELNVKQGRCEEALRAAEGLATGNDGRWLAEAVRGACRAAAKQWTAALALLQGAYVAGCRDPLCLRWLAVTLLSNGAVEAAAPVLEEWQQADPLNPEVQTYLEVLREHRATGPGEAASSTEVPGDGGDAGRYRVDAGSGSGEPSPPFFPVVSQICSADVPAAGSEG